VSKKSSARVDSRSTRPTQRRTSSPLPCPKRSLYDLKLSTSSTAQARGKPFLL
jgi:hypothetical protein